MTKKVDGVWHQPHYVDGLSHRMVSLLKEMQRGEQPKWSAMIYKALMRRGLAEHTEKGWQLTEAGRARAAQS